MKRGKSAQANIITVVLLILLVLVAVIIVWNVVKPLITEAGEKVGTEAFTVNLEIEDVKLGGASGAKVRLKRSAGEGEITALKFIFYDSDGESHIVEKTENLPDELETKIYDFTIEEINSDKGIKKVSVVPMFGTSAGIEVSEVLDIQMSCLDILEDGDSTGDGIYWINPDGDGKDSFKVYCDMTTDGGGWTLLMKATQGTTFNYDANYWTTANTLNENDVTRNDADAKYRSFNELEITDIMARWPDAGDIRWLKNSAWSSRTALQGFQELYTWGNPQNDAYWNPTYFSSQAIQCESGPPLYGTALKQLGGANYGARWGYRFNENGCGDWGSDDVGGGIGIEGRDGAWSAGDWFTCCGSQAPQGDRQMRVEVYGR